MENSGIDSQKPIEQRSRITLPTNLLPVESISSDHDGFSKNFHSSDSQSDERLRKMREATKAEGESRARFWNMLVTTVADAGYEPPQDRQTQILDLGCGRCEEGLVLSAFFGGRNFGNTSDKVKVTGVDINKADVDKAVQTYSLPDFSQQNTAYKLRPGYEFIVGDATNLSQYPQVPEQADVVVIRHQQISGNQEVWTKLFGQAIERVRPEGIILLTSFSDIEHQMALDAMQNLPAIVVTSRANQYAKPTTSKEVSVDRNVAVIKRK